MTHFQAKLIILAGSSGAGKSTLARSVCAQDCNYEMLVKTSTRPPRPNDPDQDNIHDESLQDIRGNTTRLIYLANGNIFYGINVAAIKERLAAGKSQFLVVNNYLSVELLRKMFPAQALVLFIHRDITPELLHSICKERGLNAEQTEKIIAGRLTTRELFYDQLITGRFNPDYTIINDTIENSVAQFQRIMVASPRPAGDLGVRHKKLLYIILAGTGKDKDWLLRMVETLPSGYEHLISKYVTRVERPDDGREVIAGVKKMSPGCLTYEFFGIEYGVNPQEIIKRFKKVTLGFLTISDLTTARMLKRIMEENGIAVKFIYLHQPISDVSSYPVVEQHARRDHYWQLLRLYQEQLVMEQEIPIFPVSGVTSLANWVQWKFLSMY